MKILIVTSLLLAGLYGCSSPDNLEENQNEEEREYEEFLNDETFWE